MKRTFYLICLLLLSLNSFSQVNWTNSISCILYSHCTTCHNPNGIAPFPLLTYSDAAANASAIKDQVQSRSMPPFLADVNYQQYAHQKTLTQDEIDLISNWVDNGFPSGDTTTALPAPVYASGSTFINPDFSASIGSYTVPALNNDEYRCFILSNPSASDAYITALEVIPGNRAAVHHVLIYSDDSNTPVQLDNQDPDPGYISFGGTGSSTSQLIGGFVPGSDPYYLPANMGMLVPAGSRIIIQIHYPVSASGLTDSTRVNFKYSPVAVRQASDVPALDHYFAITDGPLAIPANQVKTFHEQYTVPFAVSVLSVAPHAHLLCVSMKSYAVTPAGDTIPFEDIPHWDFHWQAAYYFQKPVHLPAGTVLYGEATYDNTSGNPQNPNDPPQLVTLGESTTDEMMLFYFVYTQYQPGDENIIIDTTGHLSHYQNCSSFNAVEENSFAQDISIFPNPANSRVTICLHAGFTKAIQRVTLKDLMGHVVIQKEIADKTADGKLELDVRALSNGLYFIEAVMENGKAVNKKLLISR